MSISTGNYLDVPTTLNTTIHASQVKISASHHKTTADGTFELAKPLVFVMDPIKEVKEEPDKKKRKESITIKNFGSKLDLGKVKSCSMLELAWRVRPAFPLNCGHPDIIVLGSSFGWTCTWLENNTKDLSWILRFSVSLFIVIGFNLQLC